MAYNRFYSSQRSIW